MATPFDFIETINNSKKDLLKDDPLLEKDYVAYVVNRQLSYFPDTIMFANEMNRCHGVPSKWQYHFYLHGLRKGKRFSKWSKPAPKTDDINLIIRAYNYSREKAEVVLSILSEDQLKDIRKQYDTGGR